VIAQFAARSVSQPSTDRKEQSMGAFVWFDLRSADTEAARDFYAQLLGWEFGDGGMVMGDEGPWAAIGGGDGASWVPYVKVDDLDQATARARELGASVTQERTAGPAGHFTTIADPGGAALALWQPA
jgi:uncharacterized protein